MAKQFKFDPAGLLDEMKRESDRAAAVLGGALIDHVLEQAFRVRLHENTASNVFEFRGPLGDFSGKIEMAFALGWIDQATRDDLTIVRKLRNEFAHDVNHELRFTDSKCEQWIRGMHVSRHVQARVATLAELPEAGPEAKRAIEESLANLQNPRGQFELSVIVLVGPIAECVQEGRQMQSDAKSVLRFVDPIVAQALEPFEQVIRGLSSGAA